MSSVPVFHILCAASFHKTGNRIQLFSVSSRPLVPLLTTYASLISGNDQGLTTTTMDWVLSILSHRKSKAWEEVKAFSTACGQRYKNIVYAKEMFPCQFLVRSQLTVSEGFGGITYCLAEVNFRVSHESVSQVKTASIQSSIYFLLASAALLDYCIFIRSDINNSAMWLVRPTLWQITRKVCVIHLKCFHQLRTPPNIKNTYCPPD